MLAKNRQTDTLIHQQLTLRHTDDEGLQTQTRRRAGAQAPAKRLAKCKGEQRACDREQRTIETSVLVRTKVIDSLFSSRISICGPRHNTRVSQCRSLTHAAAVQALCWGYTLFLYQKRREGR
eukprot:6206926-Pleurochrysis_carterae.AAC.2